MYLGLGDRLEEIDYIALHLAQRIKEIYDTLKNNL